MVILIFFFTFIFANHVNETIVTLNNNSWTSTDFYENIFFDDWESFDSTQKTSVFHDFLKKELSYIACKKEGLNLHPLVQKKLRSKKKQVMINNVYEHLISRQKISKETINTHLQNLQYKANTYHLLVGYMGSTTNTNSSISQDSAFVKINSLYNNLKNTSKDSLVYFFENLAFQHSDDPSAKQSKGLLG